MTKWTWLEWLQPDVCSYDIIVASGHSEECVQPEALSNGDNSVELEKGKASVERCCGPLLTTDFPHLGNIRKIWFWMDESLFKNAVPVDATILPFLLFLHVFCRHTDERTSRGVVEICPPQPVTPDVTSRSVSTLRSRRLGALLTEDWAIMIRSAWWEFGVWDKYLEFVSIIWPTGNGGVKPTIINLSTCCKWTKSLINPRVAQCFVVNIGGGEMLVRKDADAADSWWLRLARSGNCITIWCRAIWFYPAEDAKSLDNWTSACQKKWRHVTHQPFLVCLFLCDDFAWWSKGIICESVLTFFCTCSCYGRLLFSF